MYLVVSAILQPNLKFDIGLCTMLQSIVFKISISSSSNLTPCANILCVLPKYFFSTYIAFCPCCFFISSISSMLSRKCTCTGKLYFNAILETFSKQLSEQV